MGLDVHAETIAIAVAEPDGEVRSLGTIANHEESIRKFIRKLGPAEQLRACYEAEPSGFVLYWQLAQLGVECAVVAPTLVPRKPGDRVKTDRRDALKLARSHRRGDLTSVWVPDEVSEALRDLVRQREAAKQDQLRARNRLTKFLLRTGQRPPLGLKAWTGTCVRGSSGWKRPSSMVVKLAPQSMQQLIRALQALRGIAHISAVTIASELGTTSRLVLRAHGS